MKRKEGQSFEDYKKERKQQGENIAFYCRGRIFHNSRIDGTYNVGRNQAKREKRALQAVGAQRGGKRCEALKKQRD